MREHLLVSADIVLGLRRVVDLRQARQETGVERAAGTVVGTTVSVPGEFPEAAMT